MSVVDVIGRWPSRPARREPVVGGGRGYHRIIASFSATIESSASCSTLFAIVSDLEGHGRWARDDVTVTPDPAGGHVSHAIVAGREFHARITVEEVEESTRFVFRVEDESGVYRHVFDFEETISGCRVTRRVEAMVLDARQWLLYWLALVPVRRPALKVSLARLADLAESGESI